MKKNGIMGEQCIGESGNNKSKFLMKTFEIVDNPETDTIVSWNETRDSFVVWDVQSFSRNILPNYFRHSNFSSFLRQLHFFGFRKVDSKRYEFSNEGFKGGMKHLLKNITCKRHKYKKLHKGSSNLMNLSLEDEVEQLKKDNEFLKVEIVKLRQKIENLDTEVSNFQDRIRRAELDRKKTLVNLLQEKEEHDKVGGTQYQNVGHRQQHGTESCSNDGLHGESFDFEEMLKKLLGVSSADEKVHATQSCVDIELELFLAKSTDWSGFGGEIGEGN